MKNRYLWILAVLFFSLFCGGQADAQEISATLNQSYSSGAAYYGSQLSRKNERRIYTILVSQSRKGKILGAGVQSNGILVNFAPRHLELERYLYDEDKDEILNIYGNPI